MSVAYERAPEPRSGWDAWGSMVHRTTRVPLRLVVLLVATLVWVLAMVLVGGSEAFTALWTNGLFLVPLLVIGSSVRTVRVRSIALMIFAGGGLMGAMYLLALLLAPMVDGATRAVLVPLLEEGLKVVPVLAFLWIGRRSYSWTLGATDVLLLGAASGVGFGVVEDAYIRAHGGWPAQIEWLPVTEIIGGRLIVGHGIWTALAGATLGLALLMRTRRPRILPVAVAASGFLVSLLDHAANNYSNTRSDAVGDVLNFVSQNGWTPLWLFVGGAVACLVADALIVYRRVPSAGALYRYPNGESGYPVPSRGRDLRALTEAWAFVLDRRALALVRYQWRRVSRRLSDEVSWVAAGVEWSLYEREPEAERTAFAAQASRSTATEQAVGPSTEDRAEPEPTRKD